MPQTISLRVRYTHRAVWHDKKLQLRIVVQAQINFPVLPVFPVSGPNDRKAKKIVIKMKGRVLVGTDDCYMVDDVQIHTIQSPAFPAALFLENTRIPISRQYILPQSFLRE